MTLESLTKRDYSCQIYKNDSVWVLTVFNERIKYYDHYTSLTKIELETLRDNCKRLCDAIHRALEE